MSLENSEMKLYIFLVATLSLRFQQVRTPMPNPSNINDSTSYATCIYSSVESSYDTREGQQTIHLQPPIDARNTFPELWDECSQACERPLVQLGEQRIPAQFDDPFHEDWPFW